MRFAARWKPLTAVATCERTAKTLMDDWVAYVARPAAAVMPPRRAANDEDKTSKGHQTRHVSDAAAAGSQVRASIWSRAVATSEVTAETGAVRLAGRPACYEVGYHAYVGNLPDRNRGLKAASSSVTLRE